jgi:hypothetical protein
LGAGLKSGAGWAVGEPGTGFSTLPFLRNVLS